MKLIVHASGCPVESQAQGIDVDVSDRCSCKPLIEGRDVRVVWTSRTRAQSFWREATLGHLCSRPTFAISPLSEFRSRRPKARFIRDIRAHVRARTSSVVSRSAARAPRHVQRGARWADPGAAAGSDPNDRRARPGSRRNVWERRRRALSSPRAVQHEPTHSCADDVLTHDVASRIDAPGHGVDSGIGDRRLDQLVVAMAIP